MINRFTICRKRMVAYNVSDNLQFTALFALLYVGTAHTSFRNILLSRKPKNIIYLG